jgi:hypothetical protein
MRLKEASIFLTRGIRIRRILNGGHHFSLLGGADQVLQKRGAISIHGRETFPKDHLTNSAAQDAAHNALAKAKPLDPQIPNAFLNPKFQHLVAPATCRL